MKIENNIPIPKKRLPKTEIKGEVQAMNVGDSVVVTIAKSTSLRYVAKTLGYQITISKKSEGVGPDECRVWRTA